MSKPKEKVVIIGAGEFGEIACEHFNLDSPYEIAAFSAEKAFIDKEEVLGLPVVPFENLEQIFSPRDYKVFVALTFAQLNRARTRLYQQAKQKGFGAVSYISPRAYVWENVSIGENCFVFENSTIEHHVKIGNNVIVWSGHIGHRSIIEDNCFVASHAVISGFCRIGEYSFLGVNCSLNENTTIGRDCVVGNGSAVMQDTEPGKVYWGNPARPTGRSSFAAFKINV